MALYELALKSHSIPYVTLFEAVHSDSMGEGAWASLCDGRRSNICSRVLKPTQATEWYRESQNMIILTVPSLHTVSLI